MIRLLRTGAVVALTALALVHCGGDQKPADAPTMPSAEPPPEPMPETDAGAATSTNPQSTDTAQAKGETPAAAAPDAPAEPLSDQQIAAITDAANTAEIAQAKLAQSKSKDADVKRFAAMMVKHHGDAKQKQAKLKLKPAESSISTALESDAASTYNTLKGDKGSDFDKAYITAQVEEHQKVLDTINQKLLPNVKNPNLKALLDEMKPRVEEHLTQAKKMQVNFDAKDKSAGMESSSAG